MKIEEILEAYDKRIQKQIQALMSRVIDLEDKNTEQPSQDIHEISIGHVLNCSYCKDKLREVFIPKPS
jgi:hypothetical protein